MLVKENVKYKYSSPRSSDFSFLLYCDDSNINEAVEFISAIIKDMKKELKKYKENE